MGKKKINWDLLEPKSWFLKKSDDEELGPMNESALRQLLAGGELEENAAVRQGDSPYFPVADVRELFNSIDEEGWYIIDQGLEYGPFMPKKVRALFECRLFNASTCLIRQGADGVLTTFETELTNSRSRVRQKTTPEQVRPAPTCAEDNSDTPASAPMLRPDNPTYQEPEHNLSVPKKSGRVIHPQGGVTMPENETSIRGRVQSDGLIASYLSNLDDFDRALRAQRINSGEDVYRVQAKEASIPAENPMLVSGQADAGTSEADSARENWMTMNSPGSSTQFCPKCGSEYAITDDRCEVCFREMQEKLRRKVRTETAQPTIPQISAPALFRLEGVNSKIAVFAACATSGYFLSSWFTDAVLYRNYAGSSGALNTWVPMVSGLILAALAAAVLQFDPKLRTQKKNPGAYAAIFLVVAMVNYSIKKLDYGEAETRVQEQQELWIKAMQGGDYRITPQED